MEAIIWEKNIFDIYWNLPMGDLSAYDAFLGGSISKHDSSGGPKRMPYRKKNLVYIEGNLEW